MPVCFIWKLQMPVERKLRLAVMIGMSMFTAVASVIKTTLVKRSLGQPGDMQSVAKTFLWSNMETTFIIIMGCIPTIPQLFYQGPVYSWFISLGSAAGKLSRKSTTPSRYYDMDSGNAVELEGRHARGKDASNVSTLPHYAY